MSNPFKNLDPESELPESVKEQTMGNLYATKMIMDIIDLFVSKAGSSVHMLISPTTPQPQALLPWETKTSDSENQGKE
ncbi:MAG: hypothetical protein R3D00_24920 [Bacteroidia bacterium]